MSRDSLSSMTASRGNRFERKPEISNGAMRAAKIAQCFDLQLYPRTNEKMIASLINDSEEI